MDESRTECQKMSEIKEEAVDIKDDHCDIEVIKHFVTCLKDSPTTNI